MKKLIITTVGAIAAIVLAAGAYAQGTVVFENAGGEVVIGGGPANVPYEVALLWANGTSVVPQSSLTQAVVYSVGANSEGQFYDGSTVTIAGISPAGSAAIFEVQGWTGNYANYAAAIAGGAYFGQTAEFVNGTGNPNPPAMAPVQTTGWNGILVLLPEPSSVVLGSLGAAALWLFRRRKKSVRASDAGAREGGGGPF